VLLAAEGRSTRSIAEEVGVAPLLNEPGSKVCLEAGCAGGHGVTPGRGVVRSESQGRHPRPPCDRKLEISSPRIGGRHYTFVRPFSFNSSADSGAFFFW
jgi:hypothetical protein